MVDCIKTLLVTYKGGEMTHFKGKKVLILRVDFKDGTVSHHPVFEEFPGVTEGNGIPLPSGEKSTRVVKINETTPILLTVVTESRTVYSIIAL